MKKKFFDWQFIQDAVERLALNIENSDFEYEAVTGLPRGGLVPAVMLSHRLGIPFFSKDEGSGDFVRILIVDDICDSGVTLEKYKEFNEFVKTVTIHYKPSACYEPDFWFRMASEDEWIVYPWEREDSETIQDYKKIHDAT